MTKAPAFTLGIEEEYFLVDKDTRNLVREPSDELLEKCEQRLGEQVSPEFIRCQLEIGTKVCQNVQEVRKDLVKLRTAIAEECSAYNIAPIAASTHPFARWHEQQHTQKERYLQLATDMQSIAQRMLIGGMHIHVGIEDEDLRIDLMNQVTYFLPHLLALSCSSPFWHGYKTGLDCYRLTVFNDMPRTGLPSRFDSFSEYKRHAQVLVDAGIIEDDTKLWWDIRPSRKYPTLEVRILDICTRLDHAVSIAALVQSLFLTLYRLKEKNVRWRVYRKMLVEENRWRAMRYGVDGSLIDFGKGALVEYKELMEEMFDMVKDAAEDLGCYEEVLALSDILDNGSSAKRQKLVYEESIATGNDNGQAMRDVVDWMIKETINF